MGTDVQERIKIVKLREGRFNCSSHPMITCQMKGKRSFTHSNARNNLNALNALFLKN